MLGLGSDTVVTMWAGTRLSHRTLVKRANPATASGNALVSRINPNYGEGPDAILRSEFFT